MGQARIDADPYTVLDAHPADLLTQADREYRALIVRVFSAAIATVVVMLAAEHANQTRRAEPRVHAALHVQGAVNAERAATASPIRVIAANEVRGIP